MFPIRAGWSLVMPYSARSPSAFPLVSNRANLFRCWICFLFLFLDVYITVQRTTRMARRCSRLIVQPVTRRVIRARRIARSWVTQSGADPSGA